MSVSGKGRLNKLRQIDRAQKTTAIRRQGLLTAGVGGTDIFAEPVVVHFVDAVDQNKTGFGVVIGRGHDQVPQSPGRNRSVDFAGNLAVFIGAVAFCHRPVTPGNTGIVLGQVRFVSREYQIPVTIIFDCLHELVCNKA